MAIRLRHSADAGLDGGGQSHRTACAEAIGITVNKNVVPGDEVKPTVTSGIRLGSAACTSRGMGVDEFREIGDMILAMLGGVRSGAPDGRTERSIREGISDLSKRFRLPY